ncbi:hypothetical protein Plo01_54520 [Planobispora longispora]|uniref:Uncharacterized protein n=1 Tax=Planobispora longispora TaxID=28887 RepID=A0A8J3W7V6_9ACTN|nr:hypothetical protein GCM10020093_068440 [Planobispora longispora]GIH79023.1 hypothetical protein Plo01_54520 [Planobispora longispora]
MRQPHAAPSKLPGIAVDAGDHTVKATRTALNTGNGQGPYVCSVVARLSRYGAARDTTIRQDKKDSSGQGVTRRYGAAPDDSEPAGF